MPNVLIASLGESPAVVSLMYDLLTTEKGIHIERVRVLCSSKDSVEDGYLLVDSALTEYGQPRADKVEPEELGFEDANTSEHCTRFLYKLYKMLDEHQHNGDSVYLSLAGGRKSMAALMAWVVPFFSCIKGLYHVIEYEGISNRENKSNGKEKRFLNSVQINEDLDDTERWKYMRQDKQVLKDKQIAEKLKLVEIPCGNQQRISEQMRQRLFDIDIDAIDDEYIEPFLKAQAIVNGKLKVHLTKRAYEQFNDLCSINVLEAERFKICFERMRSLNRVHEWKGIYREAQGDKYEHFHFFKIKETAERPVIYTYPVDINLATLSDVTDVVVCELEVEKGDRLNRNKRYRSIKTIVDTFPSIPPAPFKNIDDLPAIKRDKADVLIVPLGMRPMIATQLYTLLQEREGRYINEIILVYPGANESIRTSCSLIRKAVKNELANKVTVREEGIPGMADVDDTGSCLRYQRHLEDVIERAQREMDKKGKDKKGEVLVSLSGGRKGMTAQTLFAAQNKEITYVYHTLITDEELSEQIEEETTIDELQDISKKERDDRLFLRAYDKQGDLANFALFKVPVFSDKMLGS